ncbi:hypothetical protein D3C77_383970 [compost metagenome]
MAIEKNAGSSASINLSAIKSIVDYSINHVLDNNYKSIFIPVFGLGSGQVAQSDSIDYTVSAVKSSLERVDASITVYIGVYKADDSFTLIQRLVRETL